jgi:hypothetical protein
MYTVASYIGIQLNCMKTIYHVTRSPFASGLQTKMVWPSRAEGHKRCSISCEGSAYDGYVLRHSGATRERAINRRTGSLTKKGPEINIAIYSTPA